LFVTEKRDETRTSKRKRAEDEVETTNQQEKKARIGTGNKRLHDSVATI
jgi:hypothetical protein